MKSALVFLAFALVMLLGMYHPTLTLSQAGQPVAVTNFPPDAADNAPPATVPVPIACMFAPSSSLAIGNTGYIACTPTHVLTVAPYGGGAFQRGAITTAMTGTTSTLVITGVAGNYLYITQCSPSNTSTTVSTEMILQDNSGGTTLYTIPAPQLGTAGGGGGYPVSFPVPLKVPTLGDSLYVANVTTGSSTKISCTGFTTIVSY